VPPRAGVPAPHSTRSAAVASMPDDENLGNETLRKGDEDGGMLRQHVCVYISTSHQQLVP
jgi:hypothetical protein